jgi:hypothetical protein
MTVWPERLGETTHLLHERLQVEFVGLSDHDPVSVSAERPARDGAHQGLLVGEAGDEVGDELGEVGHHAVHAALGDGPQDQDPRLLDLPVRVEQRLLQDGEQHGQDVLAEHVSEHVQRRRRALPCTEQVRNMLTSTSNAAAEHFPVQNKYGTC